MLAVLLAVPPAGADDGAATPEAAASAPRRHAARRAHPPAPSVAQAVDERLRLLSAELQLDARQQDAVRQVLLDEREQTLRVWSDASVPAPVRIKTTQDVAERTANRIRALLSEEQRGRYPQPRPGDAPTAAAQNSGLGAYLGRADGR